MCRVRQNTENNLRRHADDRGEYKSGTMKIVMKPDAEVLEEVVVTGMTKMDKRLLQVLRPNCPVKM